MYVHNYHHMCDECELIFTCDVSYENYINLLKFWVEVAFWWIKKRITLRIRRKFLNDSKEKLKKFEKT